MNRKLLRRAALSMSLIMMLSASGCASETKDAVYVESVASITGTGSVGIVNRFGGMVVSGTTQDIRRDESMTVSEILISVGDTVKVGDTLFTYDNAALLLNIEQQELEIQGMKNSISSNKKQISELEDERDRVSESDKLSYTLEIQSLEASNRETEYNITIKEKELSRQKELSQDTTVRSEINGRVIAVNKDGGYDNYGNPKPFISIMETGNLRVKGVINENNRASLYEGQQLTVMSRTDDSKWSGILEYIDWDNPVSDNSGYYYGPVDEMSTSSKYNFYITLDSYDGLFMGQHVYIDTGLSKDDMETPALMLPSYYICDIDGSAYVWAASRSDKIEKRSVSLGDYSPEFDTYEIVSGLTGDDYIAFPDDTISAGAPAMKNESMDSSDMYASEPGGVYIAGGAEIDVVEVPVAMG